MSPILARGNSNDLFKDLKKIGVTGEPKLVTNLGNSETFI